MLRQQVELIRVHVAEGKLHCVLRIGHWEGRTEMGELRAWGIVLADMIRHIANAHEAEFGRDPRESLETVREAFESEMDIPTSGQMGEFLVERNRTG